MLFILSHFSIYLFTCMLSSFYTSIAFQVSEFPYLLFIFLIFCLLPFLTSLFVVCLLQPSILFFMLICFIKYFLSYHYSYRCFPFLTLHLLTLLSVYFSACFLNFRSLFPTYCCYLSVSIHVHFFHYMCFLLSSWQSLRIYSNFSFMSSYVLFCFVFLSARFIFSLFHVYVFHYVLPLIIDIGVLIFLL